MLGHPHSIFFLYGIQDNNVSSECNQMWMLSVRTARAINHENVEQLVDAKGQRPVRPFRAGCPSYLIHNLQNVTTSLIAVTKLGTFNHASSTNTISMCYKFNTYSFKSSLTLHLTKHIFHTQSLVPVNWSVVNGQAYSWSHSKVWLGNMWHIPNFQETVSIKASNHTNYR